MNQLTLNTEILLFLRSILSFIANTRTSRIRYRSFSQFNINSSHVTWLCGPAIIARDLSKNTYRLVQLHSPRLEGIVNEVSVQKCNLSRLFRPFPSILLSQMDETESRETLAGG